MTESVLRKRQSLFRLLLIAGFALSLGGCSHWPLLDSDQPGEPTGEDPSSAEAEAEPVVEAESEPTTKIRTQAEPDPGIAVGAGARDNVYASLKASGQALAPGEIGYFVDVHEARLRQVIAGKTIRMQRIDDRLLLTIPGNLSFETDSAKVVEAAQPLLDDIAAILAEFDKTLVSVFGHTDDRGDAAYNQSLSEHRAVAVASILAKNGVARERLVGVGYGQERPAIEGDTEMARTANRRIEILIEPVVTSR